MSPAEKLAESKKSDARKPGRKVVFKCNIIEYRKKLGLTIKDVAKGTGLTRSSISVIERGSDPQLSSVCKIAFFFGVKIEELWPALIFDGKEFLNGSDEPGTPVS